MPRLFLTAFVAFVALLVGCGLSERDRAVSTVNRGIVEVDTAGQAVAARIADLPAEGALTADALEPLRGDLRVYLDALDRLNAAIRQLGDLVEPLRPHVEEVFRPSAEAAAASCQQALDALGEADAPEEDYLRAITRIGQCLERYATAVTNVKTAHDRAAD